jgi:glyoxylase-like metal-dependent hydrolase (beta-lactamase superfamily II)
MSSDLKEIRPGIFVIEERGLSRVYKPPVNIYVITGADGIVFDAGYGNSAALKQFGRAYKKITELCAERGNPCSISRIIISHAHPDHFAGLKRLSSIHNFRIIITERMAEIVKSGQAYRESFAYENDPRERSGALFSVIKRFFRIINYKLYIRAWGIRFVSNPDIVIKDNCTIHINGVEWRVFHSPGHSDDHITLYNPSTGILFGGDNILRSKFTWLGPPRSDIDLYLDSLRTIMRLPGLSVILPAHGSVITSPVERITAIISYWENRMKQVGESVRAAGNTGIPLSDVISAVYPGSGRLKREFARGWVLLVLERLVRNGEIYRENCRYYSAR